MSKKDNKDKDIKDRVKELRKNFDEQIEKLFSEATSSLFRNHENLESFSWSQSQEYNDNDYEFYVRIGQESLEINGGDQDDQDENRSTREIKQEIRKYTNSKAVGRDLILKALEEELEIAQKKENEGELLAKEVSKVLGYFNEDDYKTMFGEGSKITINRNGEVNIESYEHY